MIEVQEIVHDLENDERNRHAQGDQIHSSDPFRGCRLEERSGVDEERLDLDPGDDIVEEI